MGDEASNGFHGLEIGVHRFSGARATRVVHGRGQTIHEHQHDWPCLTLYTLGSYTELFEGREVKIASPSAVLHPAGGIHANRIDAGGLETLSIQFDPAWLRHLGGDAKIDRAGSWNGGSVAVAARMLANYWTSDGRSEAQLASATARFLRLAQLHTGRPRPRWLDFVQAQLDVEADVETPPTTNEIARRLDLHPAWMARVYRNAVGDGIFETLRRKRIERAVAMLRETDCTLADIAAATGFCDQSHMNRGMKILLGRTPVSVRAERESLGGFNSSATAQ